MARLSIPHFCRKILALDDLVDQLARARDAQKTVVQCHGCFDIVHPGHIRYLEFARRQGDILVVSLTGDSNIDKGAQRPYIPQELRAENLAALEFVDFVHIDPHPTAESLLTRTRPDVYVKGKEYENSIDPAFQRERTIVESNGGRVIFSSGEAVFSSSRLIDALPRNRTIEDQQLALLCRRHEIDRSMLRSLVAGFAGLPVLVVGDIILDRYVFCDARDIASEAPVMSVTAMEERHYVAGAAIVARHLAALGAEPTLISTVGSDDTSRQVEASLRQEGVMTHTVRTRETLVEKVRYLVDDAKLLKVDTGRQEPLDSVAEQQIAGAILERAADAAAVIFCDFGYGTITASLLERVLGHLRRTVDIITADVSGTQGNLLNFAHADLLCPTERELRHTLHDFERGLSSVAWTLMARTQTKHLFVTLDKRGMVAFDRPGDDPSSSEWEGRLLSEHLPALGNQVVDRLGCGDAMLAAATLALAAHATPMQAAYLGSAMADLEISRLGNIPIGAEQLNQWLLGRSELRVVREQALSAAV